MDLVDRGIIRILDIAFMAKDPDGSVSGDRLRLFSRRYGGLAGFEGASSGLLGQDDLQEAAAALDPGPSPPCSLWENRWAAPVAVALRRSGGQLVASGRIPIQAIIASLDASEATTESEDHHARTASRRRRPLPSPAPHGRQQPRVAPSGAALGPAGLRRRNRRRAPAAAPPPPPRPRPPDPIEQLKELAALKEQALTDEEFAAQKAKILNA